MIRDWNIIRFLLEEVESGRPLNLLESVEPEQVDEYLEHIRLLEDASLVKGLWTDVDWGEEPESARLTMEGHDLLEVLRDKNIERAIALGLPVTFSALMKHAQELLG